ASRRCNDEPASGGEDGRDLGARRSRATWSAEPTRAGGATMTQRWWIRLLGAALVVGALALVPHVLTRTPAYTPSRDLAHPRGGHRAPGNDRRPQRTARLGGGIFRLKHDLAAVEAVARDELGLVKPGDLVIQLDQRPRVEDAP